MLCSMLNTMLRKWRKPQWNRVGVGGARREVARAVVGRQAAVARHTSPRTLIARSARTARARAAMSDQ